MGTIPSLEDIRQWLTIYEQDGNQAQMRAWVVLADKQLKELEEQKQQIEEALTELKALRDETAQSLGS